MYLQEVAADVAQKLKAHGASTLFSEVIYYFA